MKKILTKFVVVMDIMAVALFIQSVNSACVWHFHQPEIPKVKFESKRISK